MSVLQPPEPNSCTVCGASPITDDSEYCSMQCYRADELVCDICGAFTPRPQKHKQSVHPEHADTPSENDQTAGPLFEQRRPENWAEQFETESPGHRLEGSDRPRCSNCDEPVSHGYFRQWATNDGELMGCPECLPRSVRFGEDVYGREPEDFDDFDPDAYNKNHPDGGVERKHGTDENGASQQ